MADERLTGRGLVRRGTVATRAAVWKFLTMGLIKQRRASAGYGVAELPPRRLAVTLAPLTKIALSLVFCMALMGHYHRSSGQEPESKKAADPAVDGAAKETDEDEQLEIAVEVVDESGPVSDASVFLQAGFKIADQQQTDSQGRTTIRYAPDLVLTTIGAVKSGVGCDYRAFEKAYLGVDKSHPNKLPQGFQGSVKFVLNGIREVSVKVIGPDGSPMPGIPVKPWLIKKPDRGDQWNLPTLEIFTASTHNDGIAVLGTIPADQQRGVQCWPRLTRDDWFVIGNHRSMDNGSAYIQWSQGNSATVHIARKVTVSGRVLDGDSQPVGGIRVVAMGGHLYTGWSNATATTDREGKWQMLVKPDGYYIFAVRDQTYAAPAHAGVVVRDEDFDRQLDFVLQPARRVYGKVNGPIGKRAYIMLQQQAADYRGVPEQEQLPDLDGKSNHLSAFIQETCAVESDGTFEFKVGPGDYVIWSPNEKTTRFSITHEEEKVFNFQLARPLRGPVTLRVVDDSNPPRPVPNAQIVGRSLESARYSRLEGTTDADGVVQVERELTELIVLAVTTDKRLARTARIDADAKGQTIHVTGACRVIGQLLDFLGEPVVGAKISLRFSTEIGERNRHVLPSQDAITGADGEFEFVGVCSGESCRVSVWTGETRSKLVSKFDADKRNIDLGDLLLTENEYDLPTATLP